MPIFNMFLFYDHKQKNGLQQDHNSEMSGQRQKMSSQQEESTKLLLGRCIYAVITVACVGVIIYHTNPMGFGRTAVLIVVTEVEPNILDPEDMTDMQQSRLLKVLEKLKVLLNFMRYVHFKV